MPSAARYIVVAHLADGPHTTDHATKTEARRAGMVLRRAGVDAFAYPAAFAVQYGLDPRVARAS